MTPLDTLKNESTALSWSPEQRVLCVRYVTGAMLAAKDGDFLVAALRGYIGAEPRPFAVLADASGLEGTDGEYRAKASSFFREYRSTAFIALINLGPLIHVVVELFRVGTGIQLKTFKSETDARGWLRTKGIAA